MMKVLQEEGVIEYQCCSEVKYGVDRKLTAGTGHVQGPGDLDEGASVEQKRQTADASEFEREWDVCGGRNTESFFEEVCHNGEQRDATTDDRSLNMAGPFLSQGLCMSSFLCFQCSSACPCDSLPCFS